MFWLGCSEKSNNTDATWDASTPRDSATETEDSTSIDDSGDVDIHEDTGSEIVNNTDDHLSVHFQEWLSQHPEYDADLTRLDLSGGSFGGFLEDRHSLSHKPIVFVHGNGDRAIGGTFGGWEKQRQRFIEVGFSNAELYATTYGPADPLFMSTYRHDVDTLKHIRQFIEAVLNYTQAPKIDVVSYSLGVTLTRKAILGGAFTDANNQSVQLGPPLTEFVDVFVGIAGANQGLSSCYGALTPACSAVDGLYPGTSIGFGITGQANILQQLNRVSEYEGLHRYSIWSHSDEVLGFGCIVWGQNTARIPEQTGEKSYTTLSHLDLKEQTFDVVYAMTQHQSIPQ